MRVGITVLASAFIFADVSGALVKVLTTSSISFPPLRSQESQDWPKLNGRSCRRRSWIAWIKNFASAATACNRSRSEAFFPSTRGLLKFARNAVPRQSPTRSSNPRRRRI